ncbi:MAG: DUF1836 domain-containing protein [Firmicutes bacterium]|nr:DUF1836 domain-containing protein [Bacillota bacterium]
MTDNTKLQEICDKLSQQRLPRWDELPDLELYMDQLLSLIRRYLIDYPGMGEKGLTAAMVNNYVKLKLIPAPHKKKYGREHLAYLLIICVLKPIIPIADIAAMIDGKIEENSFTEPVYRMSGDSPVEVEHCETVYNSFCEGFESVSREVAEKELESLPKGESRYSAMMISALKAQTELSIALGLIEEQKSKK